MYFPIILTQSRSLFRSTVGEDYEKKKWIYV